jgi:hypothetical protein
MTTFWPFKLKMHKQGSSDFLPARSGKNVDVSERKLKIAERQKTKI